jgi:thermitase
VLAIALLHSIASIAPAERSRSARVTRFARAGPVREHAPRGGVEPRAAIAVSRFRPGVVLLAFHHGVSAARQSAVERAAGGHGATPLEPLLAPAPQRRRAHQFLAPVKLRVPTSQVLAVVRRLYRNRAVAYAEPDYLMHSSAAPNDPFLALQWADGNTGQAIPTLEPGGVLGPAENGTPGDDERALAAWGVSTGSASIVIGETDTGVDYEHPDLAANVWSNPGGVGGCPAGTHGYNALANNVLPAACEPKDEDATYGGHGTHVAGILGAVGDNGSGVAGVNWHTTLLPVKWLSSAATGDTLNLIEALQWLLAAKQTGVNVRVVNDSATFWGTARSQALLEAINTLGENGILFVTAAGNTGEDNDEVARYPCDYALSNEICVTASDNNDQLPSWANYGAHTVDLAAPGVSIYSTLAGGGYGYLSGSSMAAPQVAGAAALILSVEPSLSPEELKADVLAHVEEVPSLSGRVITGGRLDICAAILGCPRPTVETTGATSLAQTSAALNGTVNPNGGAVSGCRFDYGTSESYGSSVPCSSLPASGQSPIEVSALANSLSPSTTYHFRIVASNPAGPTYGADRVLTTLPLAAAQQLPAGPATTPGGGLSPSRHKAPAAGDAELASTSLSVSSAGTVSVKVRCPSEESDCTGTVTLRTLAAVGNRTRSNRSKRRTASVVTLAVGSFTVAGGQTITVKLHLSARARELLARTRVLHARATITVREPTGAAHAAVTRVLLRASKAIDNDRSGDRRRAQR